MAAGIKIVDRSPEFKRALAAESKKIMERLGDEAARDMKLLVNRKTGNLRESIISNVDQSPDNLILQVGASSSFGRKGYHAHLVEKGHAVTRKKGGPVVGRARPHPFVEPVGQWLKMEWPRAMRALKQAFNRRFHG